MRKLSVFAAILAAVMLAFVSCGDTTCDEETTVQLSFKMMRALTDDLVQDENGLTLIAKVAGSDIKAESKIRYNEPSNIELKNIKAGSKIRIQIYVYEEKSVLYLGVSDEMTVKSGENNVDVKVHQSVIYVSEDGNDDARGFSSSAPLRTLNKAFEKIALESNGDVDYAVLVSGKITGTSVLKNVSAKSLTISAKDENAILDGNKGAEGNSGSVLQIAESIGFPVTISGITVQNGRSRLGGGLDLMGSGTTTLIGCTVKDNEAATEGEKVANGGGIRVANGSLVLKDTIVTNNTSEHNAGGIHFNGTELLMEGESEISGNTAVYTAGGICVNNGVFTMNGGKISGNKATPGIEKTDSSGKVTSGNSQGGGIRLTGGSAEKAGGKMILIDGEISGNSAEGDNGAGGGFDVTNGTLIVKGGKISANKAGRRAGAINMVGDLAVVTIEDGTISENEAVGVTVTDKTSSSYGQNNACAGAIYIAKGTLTISGGKITGNISNHNAGAINQDNGTFLMTGGEISGNTAMSNGGGIYINRSTFTMTGGKITKNKAVSYTYENASGEAKPQGGNGGGIHMNRGTFIFEGGEISENEATRSGGGIFQNGNVDEGEAGVAITELRGGVIKNNTAKECGGGIDLSSTSAQVFMYSGEITENKCTDDNGTYQNKGGGIFCKEGSFAMSGGKISSNTATSNSKGGGIYIQRGKLSLSGTITISDNEANTASQIFVQNTASSATLEYNGETIEFRYGNDENGNSYGDARLDMNITNGKLADENDTETLSRAFKIDGAESNESGSTTNYIRNTTTWSEDEFLAAFATASNAPSSEEATFTLQGNVTLTKDFDITNYGSGNVAITIDGQRQYGIEIKSANASFKNVTFKNGAGLRQNGENSNQPFGMIYWNGSTSLSFENCTFTGGKTTGDVGGGALALFGSGTVTITGCTFSGNSSTHGAAIDIGGSDTVQISVCEFSGNQSDDACDIYRGGSGATVSGSGNTSDKETPYKNCDNVTVEGLFDTN